MNRRTFLKSAAALAGTTLLSGIAQPKLRPNIVFFMVDDMGWIDSGVYGSRYYETPNVDRLAKLSMRFTNAYSAAPLCSATRASILTGKYPGRLHFTGAGGHVPAPPEPLLPKKGSPYQAVLGPRDKGYVPYEEYTLAEALKDAGYKTGFVGKWHLGHDEKHWPEHYGFDRNIGGGRWPGPPSYFSPYHISKLPDGPDGEYIADRLTDDALQFIDDVKDDGPFFLNFWQYAVHAPYQGKDEYREYFEQKKDPRGAQDNAVMGAMIKSMDESLGRVLDKLEAEGLMENTIIIFTSDNGGNMYDRTLGDGTNAGAWAPEGRTPTNNAPLRSGKGSAYEGGIRVPAMVYWPGVVRENTISQEVITSVDYYPTLLDMLDLAPMEDKIYDGVSITPALKGEKLNRKAIFGHFPHDAPAVPMQMCSWMREGDWKLIRFYKLDEYFPNRLELYNLKYDLGEMHNLAEKESKRAARMERMLDQHLAETGALVPHENPNYNPDAVRVIGGWRADGQCWLEQGNGSLIIHSIGGDPYLSTGRVPKASGDLTMQLRMRSTAKGTGQFFWTTDKIAHFGPKQRLDFHPKYSGDWETITVPFKAIANLKAIRLDPTTTVGKVEIAWVKIIDADGNQLKEWSF